ncbi:MAG TPA: lipase family protein [Candidatus Binatia bacterium]|nr:lipase family protein [Candidatus Binatia bacterium]
MNVPYSAAKEDLFYPARRGAFFSTGRPTSDAALCAEMARLAYARQEPDFAFDRDQILKVIAGIGFQECKFFENPTGPQGQGSHAFLAIDDTAKLAVLSFRGTDADDPTDLIDDIKTSLQPWTGIGKVHSGFAGALTQIWDQVQKGLSTVAEARLLFTGHSLGAAMATVAASLQLPSSLYTFGSPRVGNSEFVAALQRRQLDNHRYVDCCDVVTRVPPEGLLEYTHVGRPFYIDLARAVQERDPADEYMKEDRDAAEVRYIEDYAWRIGNVALRPLADHAPINYVWPVSAASGA